MINSAYEMIALVDSQVKTIADPIVRSFLQSLLVRPIKQQREWGYETAPNETFLCWLVLEHTMSDTGIAYSELGYGPSQPWGLVFLSKLIIGDDSGWFSTLERAFYDSYAAGDLKIWNLVKKVNGEIAEVIEEGVTLDAAYGKRDKLKLDPSTYAVEHRTFPTK